MPVLVFLVAGAALFLTGGVILIAAELTGVFSKKKGDTITEIVTAWRETRPAGYWALLTAIGVLGVGAPVLIWHLVIS